MDAVSSDATVPRNCVRMRGEGEGTHKLWGLSVRRRTCCLTHVCILVNSQSACCHLEHTGHSNENHVLEGGADTPGYTHNRVHTHQGTDTPGYRHTCIHMHRQPLLLLMPWTHIWNAMDWNVVIATTPHLVQAIFRAFPTGSCWNAQWISGMHASGAPALPQVTTRGQDHHSHVSVMLGIYHSLPPTAPPAHS